MGHSNDPERVRVVHILDFGMTRHWAFKVSMRPRRVRRLTRRVQHETEGWIGRMARGSAEFRGTPRYCSPNVHFSIEQVSYRTQRCACPELP